MEVVGEIVLWLSVLREAQLEAENGRGHPRYLAIRWLTTRSRSFDTVCAYAGLNRMETRVLQEKEQGRWGRTKS